tara:strand:+ start:142 stop:315 length:174 start_codon:yes stop_codon:yes gene_type:complete
MSGVYDYKSTMRMMEEKRSELFAKLLGNDNEEREEQEEQEMTEYEEHKLDEIRGNID